MITQCSICDQSTSGTHDWHCPRHPRHMNREIATQDVMELEALRQQVAELQAEHWQQDKLREIIAEQKRTIMALNDALGGEGTCTTDNLVRVSRLEQQVEALMKERAAALSDLSCQIARNAELEVALTALRDSEIDKLMALSDEQVTALTRIEGSNPEDVAKLGKQTFELAVANSRIKALEAERDDDVLYRKIKRLEAEHDHLKWSREDFIKALDKRSDKLAAAQALNKKLFEERAHIRNLLTLSYAKLFNAKFQLKDPALMLQLEKYLQNTADGQPDDTTALDALLREERERCAAIADQEDEACVIADRIREMK